MTAIDNVGRARYKSLRRVITNPAINDSVTFLTTARESGFTKTELEVVLNAGGNNPLHRHLTFTETFIPLKGTLELSLGGGKKLHLVPGEQFTVPVGAKHAFANPGKEAIRFKIVIAPGHEGFEYSLRIFYGLAEDGFTAIRSWKTFLMAAVGLKMGEMRLCGIHAFMNPVVSLAAKIARKKGIEKDLLNKYCV